MLHTAHQLPMITADGSVEDLLRQPPRRVLWGVAPTGEPHLGYLAHLVLLQALEAMGTECIALIANYHAFLDARKTDWPALQARSDRYRAVFEAAGLELVLESRQTCMEPAYLEALFRISQRLPLAETLRSGETTLAGGAEVSLAGRTVADALYIATQVLDVEWFELDAVLCGEDEAPIYRFGLPHVDAARALSCRHATLPMCPGVRREEMHSSDPASNKICLSDSPERIVESLAAHALHHGQPLWQCPLGAYLSGVLAPLVAASGGACLTPAPSDEALVAWVINLLRPWRDLPGARP